MSSYSRGFHFAINCWQFIVVHYIVPGPKPCPEVVAIFYIRPAKVPTLFSVEGEAQVKQQNTVVGCLTLRALACDMPHLLAFVALNIVKVEMRTTLEESSSRPHWWSTSSSFTLIPSFVILPPLSFCHRRVWFNVCRSCPCSVHIHRIWMSRRGKEGPLASCSL